MKKSIITPHTAVALTLGGMNQPVITDYQLGIILWRLYLTGQFQGRKLELDHSTPTKSDYEELVDGLENFGVLQGRKDFTRRSVFNILGKDHNSPEEIACSVDPFAYISHLSAMAFHGLTDRIPRMLFISSPAPRMWREFAKKRMEKDLAGETPAYVEGGLPRLRPIDVGKIGKHPVNRYASKHLGAFKSIRDKVLRVSTIGRTFLDMLRKPDLCGGIHHVLDVYASSAETYLDLIIDEIDRHGGPIDKVRAGYILEEICNLQSGRLETWLEYVQRGGSRKLDPDAEYRETYSERWCLSLNVD